MAAELPVVNGAHWKGDLHVAAPTSAPVTFTVPDFCGVGAPGFGIVNATVLASGSAKFASYGATLCAPTFGTITAPAGLTSSVHLSFDDGKTTGDYDVAPLDAITKSQPSERFGPLENVFTACEPFDDACVTREEHDRRLTVTAFASSPATLTALVYDGAHPDAAPVREEITVTPPVTQAHLKTPIDSGFVVLTESYADPAWNSFLPDVKVYAFVSVANAIGGDASVFPRVK